MIDLDKLKRLAQKATPGPWSFWHGWVATDIDNDGGVIIAERPTPSGGKYQARVDANFDYIAAANPAVILELIDSLEAAERNLRCCQGERMEAAALFLSVKTRLTEERDALRTKIETMEKQEPVVGVKNAYR
jgi:hypothetical protein